MVKRLLLILALGAAIAACSPSGGSASPRTETLAPATESASPAP